MKNLIIFLLFILIPMACCGQGTWNTRQDFDQGIQIVGGVTVSNVYISAGDTIVTIAGKDFILSDIRLKLDIADTASMLATYIDRSDTATMLLTYIDRSDTAAMLTPYLLSGDIAGKLDIADTAAMLVPYINRSDTAAMLTNYALLSEIDHENILNTHDTLKWINVLAWGAVGDGITDNIIVINTALVAAEDGVLYFPPGQYNISADITAAVDNVTIVGDGPGASVIYLEDGSNSGVITIGGDGWVIKDLGLNGNRDNNTGGLCSGILIEDVVNTIIDNCEIQETEDNGVWIYNAPSNIKILNTTIHDCGRCIYGYKPNGAGEAPSDVLIRGCHFYDTDAGSHIVVASDDAVDWAYGWTISHCNFTGVTDYMGVQLSQSLNTTITENFFDIGEAVGAGNPANVRISSGSTGIISNNIFKGAGNASEGHANISIIGANNVTITGNYLTNDNSKHGYGIQIDAMAYGPNLDVYNINITGNNFYNIGNSSQFNAIALYADATYTIERINIIGNSFLDDRGGSAFCDYAVSAAVTSTGTVQNINIIGNTIEGLSAGAVHMGASADNFNISNNIITDVPIGVTSDDGDDLVINGNIFVSNTTPIDINDADVTRAVVTNNNWYGCTNNINSTAATTPIITDNVDKDGNRGRIEHTAATVTLTSGNCSDIIHVNADADAIQFDMPVAVPELSTMLYDDAGGVITGHPNGTDIIKLNGDPLDAGDTIDSPGDSGDYIVLYCITAGEWVTLGQSGTWIDGGP